MPLPLKVICCGLPEALSLTDNVPDLRPLAVGENVTRTVQLPPPATPLMQSLVSEKSETLTSMVLMVRAALPTLRKVTNCGGLVVPMLWSAKVRLDFVRLAPGASAGLTLTTKALVPVAGPPVGVGNVVRKLSARVGKSVEPANPVTYALPDESTAMPLPPSFPLPPR